MMISPIEILACLGFLAGASAAVFGFGSLALAAASTLATATLPAPARPRELPARPLPARQLNFTDPHPSARCPVCRTGIHGQVRMCPRCRVLSHEDCWSFQGGCGIFGCGEKQARAE